MINHKNLIAENLRYLRNKAAWTQEYVAERINVSRQAVAKWENGDTLPDILNCAALADLYEVSLNDLVSHDAKKAGLPIAPLNKHIFGTVCVGKRGQIVLPKKARDTLAIAPGDTLIVLGDTNPASNGLALIDSKTFLRITGHTLESILGGDEHATTDHQ